MCALPVTQCVVVVVDVVDVTMWQSDECVVSAMALGLMDSVKLQQPGMYNR